MDTRITEDGKGIAALLFGRAQVGQMIDLVGSEKLQDLALLRRAAEVVEMLLDADAQRENEPAAPPEPRFEDEIEDLLDLAWMQLIGLMPLEMIKRLAAGKNLTDEQAEAVRRRAKARVEASAGPIGGAGRSKSTDSH